MYIHSYMQDQMREDEIEIFFCSLYEKYEVLAINTYISVNEYSIFDSY